MIVEHFSKAGLDLWEIFRHSDSWVHAAMGAASIVVFTALIQFNLLR